MEVIWVLFNSFKFWKKSSLMSIFMKIVEHFLYSTNPIYDMTSKVMKIENSTCICYKNISTFYQS